MVKINISGGEPFLRAKFIGEIIQYCKEELKLESTGIICNASKVTIEWLDKYGQYLDIMGVSCDSFDDETNFKIGRSEKGKGVHTRKVFQVAEYVVGDTTVVSMTPHH
jgi:radical S-adenosyl methionine domain-containing protein 2